ELVLGTLVDLLRRLPPRDRPGHPGQAAGADRVHGHADALQLAAQRQGHADDRGLGGAVVALTEMAHQPGTGRGVDDAAVKGAVAFLGRGTPPPRSGPAGEPGSPDVHAHHHVEVLDAHVPHGAIAHDPGVVHQDVQPTELVVGTLDHRVRLRLVANVTEVGDGLAASLGDELDDALGVLA